jgi:hypothetical protein
MSDHDVLMSHLIAIRAELRAYVDEYKPVGGEESLTGLDMVLIIVDKFPEDTP